MSGTWEAWRSMCNQLSMPTWINTRSGAIAGRMACVLAAALLLCASSAHGQVIEEGGFPVKGGGISGEPFSLSCPPRFYVAAGESVLFLCSATAVPEEGVRYEWKSLSGDGLHLLSDANERSPLFTAPVSEAGGEYVYRLTAMSVGVYETATVTVMAHGVSGGSLQDGSKSPESLEACDSFGALEGFREGCVAGDKMPPSFEPFEGGPEDEGGPGLLFPEAPGLPDRPSEPVRGGGLGRQAPPRLECPVAVFLEELETGQVECHAWDASGEEYLEYLWEPVGSTTRDYLDNPRLLPEDVPNPSVVAPEVPVYETLESFRLGETTFRYRYRLTATSRATGLSSSSEVEVFVSSSRPSVYCPLEVVVEEGSTVALDCEGVDPLSGRMGYDEEGASILWEWEGLWATSTAPLDATDLSSPLFTAPAGSAGEEYHYIASMTSSASGAPRTARRRVTVRVVGGGEGAQSATDDSALMFKGSAPVVTCNDSEVYEGAADITLDCSVTNESTGATYAWTARGSTSDTNDLSSTTILKPTFSVPDDIRGVGDDDYKETYEYTVTMSASGITDITADVTVTVLEKPDIYCPLIHFGWTVYEGWGDVPLLICPEGWRGAPGANPVYAFAWTARGSTANTDELSATDISSPTFYVPDEVDETTEIYNYIITVSAVNADDIREPIFVRVLEKPDIAVTCEDSPYDVDEGDADIELECEASGAPGTDPQYTWSWSPTTDLTGHDTAMPTFAVPDNVDQDKTYTYTVTATADNAEDGTAEVTVTVRDMDSTDPVITCNDAEVYEDTADFTLDCTVTDEPSGATYSWAARGSTSGTSQLSSTIILKPTFYVPPDIDELNGADKDYDYTVTLSAGGADVTSADITVTVLEKPDIYCPGTENIGIGLFEGSSDFRLLICREGWEGAPGANPVYAYAWTARGSTPDTRRLSATNIETPIFDVPDAVESTEAYTYTLTVSAANADDASAPFNVVVTERDKLDITVTCEDSPYEVDEGDTDTELECDASGGPDGSTYTWSWSPTTNLTDHNTATPMFAVPDDVDQDTTYTYTVTATLDNASSAATTVAVTVRDTDSTEPSITCNDSEVYEGAADFTLDCSVTNEPSGATYTWTARGSTANTDDLSSTTILKPTFDVPDNVDADTDYDYTVTLSASGIDDVTEDVTVTVLNKPSIVIDCGNGPGLPVRVGVGDTWRYSLVCSASGAPGGSSYTYAWTARDPTPNTDLLSAPDMSSTLFIAPDISGPPVTYYYTITATADNAEDGSLDILIRVSDVDAPPVVTCNNPDPAYEGSDDIVLDCTVTNEPSGATYAWTARGGTANTALLSSTTILKPTFDVPGSVNADTDYEYTVTLSASGINDVTEDVTVTVLNKEPLTLICTPPPSPLYEGSEDFALDCSASGAPSGSDYVYEWTARGGGDTSKLSSTTVATPTFDVPEEVASDTDYEYTLTVSAENAESATEDVTVTVLNKKALDVACATPSPVYEGSEDFALDCAATGAPAGSGYVYVWTARGTTTNTDLLVSGTNGPTPTFDVPEVVDEDETYEYLLTVSAENAIDAAAEVTVQVLNLGSIALVCTSPPLVYEGSEDFALDCSIFGDTGGANYTYEWTARGATANTDLLSATDSPTPMFAVPDQLAATTTYEYLLTARAENVEDATAEVTVTVLNRGALDVACAPPPLVYEGSADFDLDCSASGAPAGSEYAYVWTARGSTANTALLIAGTDGPTPTFDVPEELDRATTYEYLLTASTENAESGSAEVTVTVLNHGALSVVCASPASVYEGSEDFALDCSVSGAPAGSDYEYFWTARGNTANTDLLIAGTDGPVPTFAVPDAVDATTTYEYLLTASAENAESGSAEVTVTVLNHGALSVVCASPASVYEGSEDITLDCTASGAPAGSEYTYAWTAQGDTENTLQLSATDISSPTFYVPDEVDETTTYEYLLTASAENMEDGAAEVTVTVLNRGALSVVCMNPGSVYEGSEDITLDCTASGAPAGSEYAYVWTAQGDTQNTLQLSATDIPSPTFYVPDAVDVTTDYEYLLTVSVENAGDATAEVVVTVLNRGALSVVCTDPGSVYEGSEDFAFDCTASGAPGGSEYTYVWTARDSTANTDLLSRADISSPTFYVPDDVDTTTTYKYLLTASADNAEDASVEVMVTVLDGASLALACTSSYEVYEGSEDVALDCTASGAPDGFSYAYLWTVRDSTSDASLLSATDIASPAFHVPEEVDADETHKYTLTVSAQNADSSSADVTVTVLDRAPASPSPVAESSSEEPADPSSLGVTVSASSLRFGVQSAETEVSLDPMTDGISTRVSGPYHAGRMTLSPGGGEATPGNGEMALSIELASPVVLRREGGVEAASIILSPSWSFAESCEQLSSQAIGGLYTEVTLSEGACRLLRFGGELDLTDVPSGHYTGSLDIILRSGENEETHSVDVEVGVVPAQRVITIGPGGVRFSTSRELPAGLTEEQNLSIYPHVAFLTEEKLHGVFELSNPSLIPLEISVSARFGYTEATENGREVVVEDSSESHLGDLSHVVDIHPGVLVLQPGEKGLIRYGVKGEAHAEMAQKGYAAFFDVVSEPRQYVRTDQMPEEVTGDRTARVTMRVPGVYVPAEGASQLSATLLSISFVGSMSATFLLETQDHPFVGEVVAYDGDGRELGRRETLVYTRSRVRVPLDRIPEEGAVFLRFAPRGSGRVPEPASVEWDAPRRDIGEAQKEEKTPTTATVAGRP